jgi:hypothetical protein
MGGFNGGSITTTVQHTNTLVTQYTYHKYKYTSHTHKYTNTIHILHTNTQLKYKQIKTKQIRSQSYTTQTKQTPWPLVRERTVPTDRPPLVDEI